MPLHPALVHVPLGLALVLPLIALFAVQQLFGGQRAASLLVLGLSALLFVGALAGRQTGEEDEERVEKIVPEAVIEEHEEAANVFTVGAGVVLAASLVTVLLGARKAAKGMSIAVAVLSVVVAGIGINTGHKGGLIVYEHGGARAFMKTGAEPGATGATGAPTESAPADDGD